MVNLYHKIKLFSLQIRNAEFEIKVDLLLLSLCIWVVEVSVSR